MSVILIPTNTLISIHIVMFSFAQELVNRIKKNCSRFLGKCGEGLWYVMKDNDARKKAIQGKISN
jgi:hypothetical protein